MTVSIGLGRVGSNFFSLVVGQVGLGQSADGSQKWTHGQLCSDINYSVLKAPLDLKSNSQPIYITEREHFSHGTGASMMSVCGSTSACYSQRPGRRPTSAWASTLVLAYTYLGAGLHLPGRRRTPTLAPAYTYLDAGLHLPGHLPWRRPTRTWAPAYTYLGAGVHLPVRRQRGSSACGRRARHLHSDGRRAGTFAPTL